MTAKEAKANQNRIAKHYNLGWWYGTDCKQCCGVYPKLMHKGNTAGADVYYQCEVCGKKTRPYLMPFLARDAWNNDDCIGNYSQMSLF